MAILEVALDPATVIVAVDPGKVLNRIWVSNGAGLLEDPVSLPVSREGIGRLERLVRAHAGPEGPVIAIEATGSLHRSWATELEWLHPGAVRLFAPSETRAARMQLGSGRFKTDDRDCAALTYLARQGAGRRRSEEVAVDALRAEDPVADRPSPWSADPRRPPSTGCGGGEAACHHPPMPSSGHDVWPAISSATAPFASTSPPSTTRSPCCWGPPTVRS